MERPPRRQRSWEEPWIWRPSPAWWKTWAAQSMEELGGEMGQISDALTQVGGGAETVRLNISFDLEDIREGLRQIRSGVKTWWTPPARP